MTFKAKNNALLQDLKPGQRVEFELTQAAPGEYMIERIAPAAAPAAPPAPGSHAGHGS
jgi:Cu(I)/Ag(I) efflux system membrane fusion protein